MNLTQHETTLAVVITAILLILLVPAGIHLFRDFSELRRQKPKPVRLTPAMFYSVRQATYNRDSDWLRAICRPQLAATLMNYYPQIGRDAKATLTDIEISQPDWLENSMAWHVEYFDERADSYMFETWTLDDSGRVLAIES